MAYNIDAVGALDSCCRSCEIASLGSKLDTLIEDLSNDTAYSGELISDSEKSYLNSMCVGTATLGDILDNVLTSSQTYTTVTSTVSNALKASFEGVCETFRLSQIGTRLQDAITKINSMAEYDEANMLTFAIHGVSGATGTIGTNTIAVNVPYNTTLTNLVADFTVSDGNVVTVLGTEQTSGSSEQDYTNPVAFVVTSQTGDVTKTYTVTITTLANTESHFVTFVLAGADGVIDTELNTIAVETPLGTNLASLAPTFTVSEQATVFVGSTEQTSAVTLQDFSSAIVYRVVAGDESYTDYTITATVAEA